ncbi:fatty acid--CoA ligase family protein [soil metagenome]
MNLATIIDGHDGGRPAVISRNQTTTYGELADLVGRARGGLTRLGIGDGDRIGLVCTNGLPFVVVYLATLGVGAVAVPLTPSSPAAELEHQLSRVDAAAVVVDQAAAAWAHVDRGRVPSLRAVVAADGATIDGSTSFADLITGEPAPLAAVASDHLAVLMFTSGTAGSPRAAMLTHGGMRAHLVHARSARDRLGPDDVTYGVIPLFHIFGLNVVLGASLFAGAAVLLVVRFDPATALESFRARGVTAVPGAPAMWVAFSDFDDMPADAFASVRLAYSGAAKLPLATSERLRDRFGLVVAEGYGLTEASPIVTSSSGLDVRPGSVGAVLDGIDMRIVDEHGDDTLVGDAGEIWIKGPNVFAGYLDDPEATSRVLTDDGWLRTGDIAYCDDDGRVYLVDRAKDLVIVSGFNVFPAEVEDVLVRHPDVVDVGVIGVPHPHTGEAVKAFVVVRPDATLDADTLIDFALDHLARYKCPSTIVFVDALPRNSAGKLVRRQLEAALTP